MANNEELITRLDDGVLWLTLNRPERRNALSYTLFDALRSTLTDAEHDDAIGAVVLTGAGGSFCAGGDVSRMNQQASAPAASAAERVADLRARTQITELLHNMPKPTIAMIRGAAAGAGLSLALACDLRYADDTAKFRTSFINVGLSGDFGGHYFLPRIVGAAKARELYLCSPLLTAAEAASIGLINQLLDADALAPEVTRIASALANGPRPAIAHIKANLNDALDVDLVDMLDKECRRHVDCADSADHKEAVRAFVEKRTPVFNRH